MSNRGRYDRGRGYRRDGGYNRSNRGRRNDYGAPVWKSNFNQDHGRGVGSRLAEKDIGVTEYVSDFTGIHGIIKSRFSDFHVNEIGLDGKIAILNDTTLPAPPAEDPNTESSEDILEKGKEGLLDADIWEKLKSLTNTNAKEEKVEIDVTEKSKEIRSDIYASVRKSFGTKIYGVTESVNDKKLITFKKFHKGDKIDRRVKWVWPGVYVHFLVHKINMTTAEAATQIAESVRIPTVSPAYMGFAGTKDRRAVTTQWFTLRRVEPAKILIGCHRVRNIEVGNFHFSDKNLKLGDLKGNKFQIALRNITATEEDIAVRIDHLKTNGFINYYGLQRFGNNRDIPTYLIGMKLLQGAYKEAAELILAPKNGPLFPALDYFKRTGSAKESFDMMHKHLRSSIEGRLMKGLQKSTKPDYMTSLFMIPRGTRTLYLHAYQSLIWNKCVTERIKKFGFQVAVGDLVLDDPIDNPSDLEKISELEDAEGQENENESDDDDEIMEEAVEKVDNCSARPKIIVKTVTDDDVASNKYCIFDVILPLPGYAIEYPANMKDTYDELSKEDKIDLNLKQKSKSFSLSGAYRHIVTCPKDVEWQCVKYTDPMRSLILSDYDRMLKRSKEDGEDGKHTALLLDFTLPACSYATMVLRELLKSDTSSESQAIADNYFKKNQSHEGLGVPVKKKFDVTDEPEDKTTDARLGVPVKREFDVTEQSEDNTTDARLGVPVKREFDVTEQSEDKTTDARLGVPVKREFDVTEQPEDKTTDAAENKPADAENKIPDAENNVTDAEIKAENGDDEPKYEEKKIKLV